MPGSLSSVFGEPEDLQVTLSEDGVVGLLITGRGQFRARLTRITLHHLRLTAVEEQLARIAFVAVPASAVPVLLPNSAGPSPVWDGIEMRAGEMITLGPCQRMHARTDGPRRWAAIQMPDRDLIHYGRALRGAGFVVPPAARWRPPPAAVRELSHLHRTAVRMAEGRSGALADVEAAHGLEQQLIHALIDCLSAGPADCRPARLTRTAATRRLTAPAKMGDFAAMDVLDIWYARLDDSDVLAMLLEERKEVLRKRTAGRAST